MSVNSPVITQALGIIRDAGLPVPFEEVDARSGQTRFTLNKDQIAILRKRDTKVLVSSRNDLVCAYLTLIPYINPTTGNFIELHGDTYTELYNRCADYRAASGFPDDPTFVRPVVKPGSKSAASSSRGARASASVPAANQPVSICTYMRTAIDKLYHMIDVRYNLSVGYTFRTTKPEPTIELADGTKKNVLTTSFKSCPEKKYVSLVKYLQVYMTRSSDSGTIRDPTSDYNPVFDDYSSKMLNDYLSENTNERIGKILLRTYISISAYNYTIQHPQAHVPILLDTGQVIDVSNPNFLRDLKSIVIAKYSIGHNRNIVDKFISSIQALTQKAFSFVTPMQPLELEETVRAGKSAFVHAHNSGNFYSYVLNELVFEITRDGNTHHITSNNWLSMLVESALQSKDKELIEEVHSFIRYANEYRVLRGLREYHTKELEKILFTWKRSSSSSDTYSRSTVTETSSSQRQDGPPQDGHDAREARVRRRRKCSAQIKVCKELFNNMNPSLSGLKKSLQKQCTHFYKARTKTFNSDKVLKKLRYYAATKIYPAKPRIFTIQNTRASLSVNALHTTYQEKPTLFKRPIQTINMHDGVAIGNGPFKNAIADTLKFVLDPQNRYIAYHDKKAYIPMTRNDPEFYKFIGELFAFCLLNGIKLNVMFCRPILHLLLKKNLVDSEYIFYNLEDNQGAVTGTMNLLNTPENALSSSDIKEYVNELVATAKDYWKTDVKQNPMLRNFIAGFHNLLSREVLRGHNVMISNIEYFFSATDDIDAKAVCDSVERNMPSGMEQTPEWHLLKSLMLDKNKLKDYIKDKPRYAQFMDHKMFLKSLMRYWSGLDSDSRSLEYKVKIQSTEYGYGLSVHVCFTEIEIFFEVNDQQDEQTFVEILLDAISAGTGFNAL